METALLSAWSKRALCILLCAALWVGCGGLSEPHTCKSNQECHANKQCINATCQPTPACTGTQCQERTRELPTREANTSDAGPETNQNTDSTDHREGQREEGQTDNTPDTTSPKGCIKGTIRPCKQPNQTAQNCFPGKQTCKSDETWGECQVTKVENPFATPQATLGEICNDNIDNNCNGIIDEGCKTPQKNECIPVTNVHHTVSHEGLYMHPAALSQLAAYSPNRRILLQPHHGNPFLLDLVKVHKLTTWQLSLRLPQAIYHFDLSKDGTYAAATTRSQLLVWHIQYDANDRPSLRSYRAFDIPNAVQVKWAHPQGKRLLTLGREPNKAPKERTLALWNLAQTSGKLELQPAKSTTLQGSEGIRDVLLQVHPLGSFGGLFSERYTWIIGLPMMTVLKRIPNPEPGIAAATPVFHPTKPQLLMQMEPKSGPFTVVTVDASNTVPVTMSKSPYSMKHLDSFFWVGFEPTSGELYANHPFRGLLKWVKQGSAYVAQHVQARLNYQSVASLSQQLLFVATLDDKVKIFSTQTGALRHELVLANTSPHTSEYPLPLGVSSVSYHEASKTLAALCRGTLSLWRISESGGKLNAQRRGSFSVDNRFGRVTLSPDGAWLIHTSDTSLQLWKRDASGDYQEWTKHALKKGRPHKLSFHPTTPYVVWSNDQNEIVLLSLGDTNHTPQVLKTLPRQKDRLPGVGVGFVKRPDLTETTMTIVGINTEGISYTFHLKPTSSGQVQVQEAPNTQRLFTDGTRFLNTYVSYDGYIALYWAHEKPQKKALYPLEFRFDIRRLSWTKIAGQTQPTLQLQTTRWTIPSIHAFQVGAIDFSLSMTSGDLTFHTWSNAYHFHCGF